MKKDLLYKERISLRRETALRAAMRKFVESGGGYDELLDIAKDFCSVTDTASRVVPKGQYDDAKPAPVVLPKPAPVTPEQRASAKRVASKVAATVLDTFTITERQGSQTPLGDIRITSYPRILERLKKKAWVSSREYNLIYLLDAEAKKIAHVPLRATTRDIFDAATAKRLIAMAADLAMPALQHEERPND